MEKFTAVGILASLIRSNSALDDDRLLREIEAVVDTIIYEAGCHFEARLDYERERITILEEDLRDLSNRLPPWD